jgi:hypothetical protein
LIKEFVGITAFREATGLGWKWLDRAEEWYVITPLNRNGEMIYSPDDLSVAKLMVNSD